MNEFLAGALCAMSWTAAIYFLRSWRDTRDMLFAFFSAAFGLFAIHWAWLVLVPAHIEAQHRVYLLRLAAFVLLLFGIFQKNWKGDRR